MHVSSHVEYQYDKHLGYSYPKVGTYTTAGDNSGLTLTDHTQLRFRNYANATNDMVFIDEVQVSIK